MKDRRQMWRVLEFAAQIAQEDEYTAMSLLNVAAGALSFGHPLQREVANLAIALQDVLTTEAQSPMFPAEQQNTPTQERRQTATTQTEGTQEPNRRGPYPVKEPTQT